LWRLFADAVEGFVGAEEDSGFGDGGGGVEIGFVAELVCGDEIASERDDEGAVRSRHDVELSIRHDRGSVYSARVGEAFLEDRFSVRDVEYGQDASFGDAVDPISGEDRRRDVSGDFLFPEGVRFGDIIQSTRFYRDCRAVASADGVDNSIACDDASTHDAIGETFGEPTEFTISGVESPDLVGDVENEFGLSAGEIDQNRGRPGTVNVIGGRPPDFLAGFLIQSDQGFRFRSRIDDDEIFIEDRTGARAPVVHGGSCSHIGFPEFFAFEIEGENARFSEEDVEPLAITNGSARCISVVANESGEAVFGGVRRDFRFPNDSTVGEVATEEMAFQVFLVSGFLSVESVSGVSGDVDAILPDDRGGTTVAGEFCLPGEILGISPFFGEILRFAHARSVWATKPGPLGTGGHFRMGDQQAAENQTETSNACGHAESPYRQSGTFTRRMDLEEAVTYRNPISCRTLVFLTIPRGAAGDHRRWEDRLRLSCVRHRSHPGLRHRDPDRL